MAKRAPALVPLSWDHHHGLVMARRIDQDVDGGPDVLAALYSALLAFWSAGLLPHFRVENECLLARLVRHVPDEAPEVQRLMDDHLRIEALVATMRDTTEMETRRDALRRFAQMLRDHIRWEESVLFEVTQQKLTPAEMSALAEDINAYLPALVPAPAREP